MFKLQSFFASVLGLVCAATHVRATPPDFGPRVLIFDSRTPNAQKTIDDIFSKQQKNQFGTDRYALLFKPGKYPLDVHLGFYTEVCGLGRSPDDVSITGEVFVTAEWMHGNATCNFWRSAENLAVTPTHDHGHMTWAVSQGVSLRRVHVLGDLHLWDNGWSSGGFLADAKVDGLVVSGSQQQWFSRNSEWNRWDGGVWNMVFVGAKNSPQPNWPRRPYTVIEQTPVIREKPFLCVNDNGEFGVAVPPLNASGSQGVSWSTRSELAVIPIEQFYLAHPDQDDSDSINAALTSGKNLLFTPGVYHLKNTLRIARADTVVLGLGLPTLVPERGTSAIEVADVDGVKIAGLLLDAGLINSKTLLQVGDPTSETKTSHSANPTFLYDIYCRAGGATVGRSDCFITLNSSNVVADNLWLWRADHGAGAAWDENRNANGLIVNGQDVTIYGLFVEHCQEYQTLWNGDGGRVYFYQSEMPYDPPSQADWSHDGRNGFASYKVADSVTSHQAFGLGVYCIFRDASVLADSALEAPNTAAVQFHHITTIRLGGQPNSGISHILNAGGAPVITTQKAQLADEH